AEGSTAKRCDVLVKGIFQGQARGFFWNGTAFQPDRSGAPVMSAQELINAADAGAELTFTGVPSGAGRRLGIDRDGDGTLDGDEQAEQLTVSGRVTTVSQTPVSGVTVTLAGPQVVSAQTGADGRYSFTSVPTGDYTITPVKDGAAFAP